MIKWYEKKDFINEDEEYLYDDSDYDYPQYAGMIHIRTKITPQGPKQEKIKNYQALVDKGIL